MAVKAVKFHYQPSEEVLQLLFTLRDMVNEAIRIGLERNIKSRFSLITEVYHYFKERYGLHTHYILSACESAFAIIRNHRRRGRRPYVKHLFLKLDNQTYQLNYTLLRIPVRPRQFILMPLKMGEYQAQFLRDATLKRGSVTITATGTVVVAFSKESATKEPLSKVAYDINEKNVTGMAEEGRVIRYDTSRIANLRHQYSRIRASIASKMHRDRRRKQILLSKYGRNEKNRATQALHLVSKTIVQEAKKNQQAIILERRRGILFSHRRGNGEGRKMRGRLHRWTFGEVQHQIGYKSAWEGVTVEREGSPYTSKTCSGCGAINRAFTYERMFICPNCGMASDRDLNAAKNILARSLYKEASVVRSSDERPLGEGMVQLATVTR